MKAALKKFGKWLVKNAATLIELFTTGKTSQPLAKKK